MIIKVNKQTLAMEEVEQFDSISLEDLAEGKQVDTRLDSSVFH